MKILVAIGSNAHGINQPIRDTWLKSINSVGFEYKFFYGEGQAVEEDHQWKQSCLSLPPEYETKLPYTENSIELFGDEVALPVPDDHLHVPYKTREIFRYALNFGFDFVFKCFEDTYVSLPRLSTSHFETADYTGRLCGNHEMGAYASGGPGYWLSKRSLEVLAPSKITRWADDWWVGNTLQHAGIPLSIDSRYAELFDNKGRPRANNSVISSHLAVTPTVYTADLMYEAHNLAQTEAPDKRRLRRWTQPTT